MKKQIFKLLILSSFMITGCAADLKTKSIVSTELKEQSVSVVDNFFNLTYVENHGIAFGMLNNVDRNIRMPIIFALPILATLLCLVLIWKARKRKFRLLLPIFVILGGAYGNIIDRALNGFVTDFLHFHYFHRHSFFVFNVADVLINIGLILIILQYRGFNRLLNSVFNKEVDLELN